MRQRGKHVWGMPVISKHAVRQFLLRKRQNYLWMKDLPKPQLLRFVQNELGYEATEAWWQHQLACFAIASNQSSFYFDLDMGAGKSKLALDIIRYHYLQQHNTNRPAIVLVPADANVEGWVEQIQEHAPEMRVSLLVGARAEREEAIEEDADIYLINYPGLQVMMGERVKKKVKVSSKRARDFASRFGMVIGDEAHLIGNHQTLTYRFCRILAKRADFVYLMSGTPFGRDPTKLWSQFYLMDGGETLGESLGVFRAAFFEGEKNYWGGIKWTFREERDKMLHRFLQNRSIRYDEKEFADMPPMNYAQVPVALSENARKMYDQILNKAALLDNSVRAVENIFVRLRQITAGFLSLKGDDGTKVDLEFPNVKLEALRELLLELPPDSKVVIFHEFVMSGILIRGLLKEMKIRHAMLGHGTKKPMLEIRKFKNVESCRAMVANSKSGGTGHNFHGVCNYIIFYEAPVSPITRKQAIKRVYRASQTKRVFMRDIVARRTIDERVLSFLKDGEDLFQAVCNGGLKVLQ
jgi:SNF2 family DNA or RNA helicase